MRFLLLLALFVFSPWLPARAAPRPTPAASPFGRVTAHFDGTPLRQVLTVLFQRSGARYVLDPAVSDVAITARLSDLDVESALKIVTRLAGATYTRVGDRFLIRPLSSARPAAPSGARVAATRTGSAVPPARFDLQLRDVPLRVALDQLFRGTGRQYAVEAQVPDVPVTLTLRATDFATALRTMTRLAGAEYRQEEGAAGIYVIGLAPTAAAAPGPPATVSLVRAGNAPPKATKSAVSAAPLPADKPLSLDLRQVPFRKALEQLFQLSGREYAVTPAVPDALISLRLRDVPFMTAFETLLRLAGASYRQEGSLFVVLPGTGGPKVAQDAEPVAVPTAEDLADLRVDLSLDRVPFRLALETLFAQVKVRHEFAGNVENVPVTIDLRDVDFVSALRTLTRLVGATYEKVEDRYVIRGSRR